jgi:hypothetical protein
MIHILEEMSSATRFPKYINIGNSLYWCHYSMTVICVTEIHSKEDTGDF